MKGESQRDEGEWKMHGLLSLHKYFISSIFSGENGK